MKPKNIKIIDGGVCAAQGFYAAGLSCGIKKSNKKDLALVYTPFLSSSAGVFTKNKVKAAPVIISQKNLDKGKSQAIIINSGNANAATGAQGIKDANFMKDETANALRISKEHVLVASTGIIGLPLPMKKITSGIWSASRMINKSSSNNAAEAILTTDLRKKEIAIEISFGKNKIIKMGGIAKGSGMICPNMATMICVITTDAAIDPSLLKKALLSAVDDSFNMITVDGDMSTNDCVLVLANGQSLKITNGSSYNVFLEGLKYVCAYLAKEIARDGEGATKIMNVVVNGAKTLNDARMAAKAVANSPLVKCALYGADPNAGRILAAIGYSGANFDPNKVEIFLGNLKLAENGVLLAFDHAKAVHLMKKNEVTFVINLKNGKHSASALGCDLTEGYIKINARYHT